MLYSRPNQLRGHTQHPDHHPPPSGTQQTKEGGARACDLLDILINALSVFPFLCAHKTSIV